ncbi:hypothetical protein NECAME_13568 [Necator americanus]|nr:hypothetical protein NECAME_13568 [Necator americanus]ETN73273.1 hypothetical protein NECAME_13568 [Necator americanus]
MSNILKDYKNNVTADSGNACKYAQNLMNSYGTIYRNGACRATNPDDGQWYGCESGREYTNAQFRHCQHSTKC